VKAEKGGIGRAGRMGRAAATAVFAIVSMAFFTTAAAAPVSFERAQDIARKRSHSKSRIKATTPENAKRGLSNLRQKQGLRKAKAQDITPFFVFEKEEGGFIIVAGDDIAFPILGETSSGTFDEAAMPPAMIWLLGTFEDQITQAVNDGVTQDGETAALWDEMPMGIIGNIEPLLKTTWDQDAPYNGQCPMDGVSRRSLTGCVATAMAQIMKYHRYPEIGSGSSEPYTGTSGVSVPEVTFDTYYNYDLMENDYPSSGSGDTEKDAAVAQLMYHAGVSVKMDYGSSASGASSFDVVSALIENFGYDESIKYIYADAYIPGDHWIELIKGQLENGAPVYYGGSDPTAGGHAFIVHGYNASSGAFNINWGWGGSQDGLFQLTALTPSRYNFNDTPARRHSMIINIMPDQNGNAPSVIRVTNFDVSTNATSINANITAGMYYGQDFSGEIGLGVVSVNNELSVLNSRSNFSVRNPYTVRTGPSTLQMRGPDPLYSTAAISKNFSPDMLTFTTTDVITVQTVTKRGTGEWTPVGPTAQVTIPTYSVTWDAAGGAPAPAQSYVFRGTPSGSVAAPAAMDKTGHTFGGWYRDAGFTTPAVFPITSVTADINLYAKWVPNVYSVTYNLDGGTQQDGTTWGGYTYGAGLILPTAPTKDGYIFDGWYDNSDLVGSCVEAISETDIGDKLFWAKWKLIIMLSGTVTITGDAEFGQTLTAVTSGLSSAPSIENLGEFAYQWQRGGDDISGATGATYALVQADIGHEITVTVTAANCVGGITSGPTDAVSKAAQTIIPDAPELDSKTYNSVTLIAVPGYEYSRDGTSWRGNNVFVGLSPSTPYTFYQRIAETEDTEASSASDALDAETDDPPPDALIGAAEISNMNPRIGDELTGQLIDGNGDDVGTLTYIWKADGEPVGEGETYTVAAADLGKEITLEITSDVKVAGMATCDGTAVVLKALKSAPGKPAAADVTTTSITLVTIDGAEYCMSATAEACEWRSSPTFSGLVSGTSYTFYAYYPEIETHYASEVSVGSEISTSAVTTDPNPGSGTGSIISPIVVTPQNKDQSAPGAPTASTANITPTSVTLNAISGAEYCRTTGGSPTSSCWTTNRVFSNLTPNTEYTFYARLAAKNGYNASPASRGTKIRTSTTAVLDRGRVVPAGVGGGAVVLPPDNSGVGADGNRPALVAGPNPVARTEGLVKFFRQGKRVDNATLTIYDAAGNVIAKVKVVDNALGTQDRRQVAEWDLRDARGVLVSEGSYLVRGVVKTADGKREKVSAVVGVR
jgi:uncharacterized repeat protein (TIGR02543 family)